MRRDSVQAGTTAPMVWSILKSTDGTLTNLHINVLIPQNRDIQIIIGKENKPRIVVPKNTTGKFEEQ